MVVGVPGRVISFEGSVGYVNRTDYPGSQAKGVRPQAARDTYARVSAAERSEADRAMGEGDVTREERDRAGTRHCVQ